MNRTIAELKEMKNERKKAVVGKGKRKKCGELVE